MNNFTFRIINSRFLLQVVVLMTLATYADAAVTNPVWYRLGEDDPGAAPGTAATATLNLIGGRNLTETWRRPVRSTPRATTIRQRQLSERSYHPLAFNLWI